MKIAYISSAFLSDCDLPLLRELHSLGHEVCYFLMMSDSSRQATVINVPALKPVGGLFPASLYSSLSWLEEYLPIESVFVVNMPKAHDWSPSSLKAVWQLYRFVGKGGFDAVHVTSPLRYGAFMLYALRGKMVMTMHDPLPHSSDLGLLNRMHRSVAFHAVDHFIVLSSSLKEEFVRVYGLQDKDVSVSRLGAYDILSRVKPQPLDLPEEYILFTGSINPHKGIKYLCEAMKILMKTRPGLRLVIAGRGRFDFDIAAYLRECPITIINRFVTDGELSTLISGSRMVVCPYVDATQSGVIMSSFALSKPVVATRVGALEEMLTDGRHGLLVPPRDSGALARAVEEMLEAGTLGRMAENIRADYSEGDRSWNSIARETVRIYNNVKNR